MRTFHLTHCSEITHSWSGNWVTNARWDDFWLNEGNGQHSRLTDFHKHDLESAYCFLGETVVA